MSENQTKGKCEEKYKYKESDYVNEGQEQDEMCFPSVDFNDVGRLLRGNRHSGVCQCLFAWPCVCVCAGVLKVTVTLPPICVVTIVITHQALLLSTLSESST